MIKKLIIVDLILIFLVLKLPQYDLRKTNNEIQEDIVQEENIVASVEVSSRSLEETRTIQEEDIIEVTTISENCINLVKKYEGLRLTAYLNEEEQYYTIGYGHHGADVKEGQIITEEKAEQLLKADLQGYADLVLRYCDYLNLTQNELDALISFTYNTGYGNLKKLTANKTRTKEEIAEHFLGYVNKGSIYENGLTKRRVEEKNLFLGGEN